VNGLWWLPLGALVGAWIALNLQDARARLRRAMPPAPADSCQPGPGQDPVPGKAAGTPVTPQATPAPARPPRDGIYGRCTASAYFFDTGITVTYDHVNMRRHVDIPPADQWDGTGEWLQGLAP
jgi:hypothetical protein